MSVVPDVIKDDHNAEFFDFQVTIGQTTYPYTAYPEETAEEFLEKITMTWPTLCDQAKQLTPVECQVPQRELDLFINVEPLPIKGQPIMNHYKKQKVILQSNRMLGCQQLLDGDTIHVRIRPPRRRRSSDISL